MVDRKEFGRQWSWIGCRSFCGEAGGCRSENSTRKPLKREYVRRSVRLCTKALFDGVPCCQSAGQCKLERGSVTWLVKMWRLLRHRPRSDPLAWDYSLTYRLVQPAKYSPGIRKLDNRQARNRLTEQGFLAIYIQLDTPLDSQDVAYNHAAGRGRAAEHPQAVVKGRACCSIYSFIVMRWISKYVRPYRFLI